MNKGKESEHRRQRDIQKKIRLIQAIYFAGLTLLFFLVVLTPYFIQGNFQLKNRGIVREEIAEGAVIALLLIVGYLASILHKKEFDKYHRELEELVICKCDLENRLNDAFWELPMWIGSCLGSLTRIALEQYKNIAKQEVAHYCLSTI
jgi:hypothetical protein